MAGHEAQQGGPLDTALLDDRELGASGHDLIGEMLVHPAGLTLGINQQATAFAETQLPNARKLAPLASKSVAQHSGALLGDVPDAEPPFMPKLGG